MTRFNILNKDKKYKNVDQMVDSMFSGEPTLRCALCPKLRDCRGVHSISEQDCRDTVKEFLSEDVGPRTPSGAILPDRCSGILPIISIDYVSRFVSVHDEEKKLIMTTDIDSVLFRYDGMTHEEISEFMRVAFPNGTRRR